MIINTPPLRQPFADGNGIVQKAWAEWINQAYRVLFASQQSGTTTERPTTGLYPGRPFFDTTLNQPIWRNSANDGWVDSTGTAA